MSASAMTTNRAEDIAKRLLRGSIGGLIAGAAFIGATMWFASSLGDPADAPLMMISTLVQGEEAMEAGTASPALGLLVHAVLSAAFGVVFALIAPRLATNGTVALAGTIYGALLYVVNFLVIAPLAFPIFEAANQPFELVVHVLFGTLLSLAFFGSDVRRGEGVVATNRRVSTA
jgi:uncharacterized membrane protein YagU involved in acid resistance